MPPEIRGIIITVSDILDQPLVVVSCTNQHAQLELIPGLLCLSVNGAGESQKNDGPGIRFGPDPWSISQCLDTTVQSRLIDLGSVR